MRILRKNHEYCLAACGDLLLDLGEAAGSDFNKSSLRSI